MIRFSGFCLGLLLANLPYCSAAQTAAARPLLDSAFAVHQLFKKHRHAAEGALGTGAASIVGMVASSARGEREMVGLNALVTVVATAIGLRQAFWYSSEHEGYVVQRYEQGWPLPADVRRRLKPKYFRAAK